MSIVKRNGDGKLKFDWSAVLTLIISALLGGIIAAPGVYYGIRYDLRQQDYRITQTEHRIETIDVAVNNMRLKDAGDSVAFAHACDTLKEIKDAVNEIRKDQQRRARGN